MGEDSGELLSDPVKSAVVVVKDVAVVARLCTVTPVEDDDVRRRALGEADAGVSREVDGVGP